MRNVNATGWTGTVAVPLNAAPTKTMRILAIFTLALGVRSAAFGQANAITVYPGPAAIEKATSRQMSAYVPISPNTVTWAINGVVGGNATYGTVTPTGLYKAPAVVPADNEITIKVTSTAFPTKYGTAKISIKQPQTWVWSAYPNKFAAGAVSLSINGSGFVPGVAVTLNNVALPTTYVSATSAKVNGNVPVGMVGVAQVRAVNPAPGATTSEPYNVTVTASAVSVSVSPTAATLPVNATQNFTATVTGTPNTAVTWTTTAGTITSGGVYKAPASLPSPASAVVKATSVADPLVSASANITLTQPSVTVTVSPQTAQLALSGTQQFAAAVVGNANTAVTWAVNGVTGGNATLGSISAAGLYTAPAILPTPATVSVRATSVAAPSAFGQASVTVKLPPPAMPNLSHARFLEQAAFGPSPVDMQSIGQLGIDGWLGQQFAMSETFIPLPDSNGIAQSQYLSRLVHAPDQLRQRMVNALAKIIVLSAAKNPYPNEVIPYWQILSRNAFGSYRQLLYDITVSPQMGKYLDLANSKKPSGVAAANENYPRELMQLFANGLVMLNTDGSVKLSGGQPIPAYNQTVVSQTALALTGWTYPTPPGGAMGVSNWESFTAPAMEPREQFHDKTAKTLIGGCAIPAGLGVVQETNMVVDCVFNHPNTAPFIVTRLIRDMVTSNPSGAYVQRVVNVWNNNGNGVKGDLKAVLTAILTDAEARQDQATPQQGRLKNATYHIVSFIRAMNGSLTPTNLRAWNFTQMGEAPLGPPSVFGHYSLLYRIPNMPALAGPEFQIYTPTESMLRGNMIYDMLTSPNASDMKIDLTPFQAVAGDPSALIEQVNAALLYGRMPQSMKDSLAVALAAGYDNNQRMVTALYLTALSGYYTVQF